ncbi:ORF6N domain-containing protein [uncultured Duncaniella sp.]|uniref:ORF6N domain-containing protein n=2 Tax=uncultured Duncaniella sp. TaxID=2768039 RepID=UPI000AF9D824|nr:ORF6N domain-containing protein [uncultured Duncaniella sp.]
METTQENNLSIQNIPNKEPVTYCDRLAMPIENRILTLRGKQVMIDRDLAELYGVETKVLNQAVKRNVERFPEHFRFQLSNQEKDELVTNCDRFNGLKHSSVNPFAFTEQGVAMLSAVLKSETAVYTSIRIIDAFVAMRNFLMNNASIFQRMERIEMKQLKTDEKVDAILDRLNEPKEPEQGVFFNGQIFDAYAFIAKLIRKAKKRIVVIDSYVDDSVLVQLSKRNPGVTVDIYDGKISLQLRQDVARHNAQYPGVTLHAYNKAHDRFLIIDEEVYHIGHSLKDLGKKLFAFSKMDVMTGTELISQL